MISALARVATGSLYPILLRFEVAGWLDSKWEDIDPKEAGRPRKRFYWLTPTGFAQANEALRHLGSEVSEVPAWMIVLAIICGILANDPFAWGPRFSDLLLKIRAAASFLLSTFWGFRRYREDETPIEIEERIALEVAFALNQESQRIQSALEELLRRQIDVTGG